MLKYAEFICIYTYIITGALENSLEISKETKKANCVQNENALPFANSAYNDRRKRTSQKLRRNLDDEHKYTKIKYNRKTLDARKINMNDGKQSRRKEKYKNENNKRNKRNKKA